MVEYLKNINWKHVLIMCIGNVFMGMGIGIFKLAGLGTDPFSGMNMAVADMIGGHSPKKIIREVMGLI